MKKNLGAFFGLTRWGVGAVLLALCAFSPATRADVVIVDNLPGAGGGATYPTAGATSQGSFYIGEVFAMPIGGGNLSSVTLDLNFVAADSASVYLYGTSSGKPSGTGILLGKASSLGAIANDLVNISGLNNPLLGGDVTSYAIVLGPDNGSGNMSWNKTTTAGSEGSGSLGGGYLSFDNISWSSIGAANFQMEVISAVPEVPMTGMVMGFGALAIALGHTLRRKFRPAV